MSLIHVAVLPPATVAPPPGVDRGDLRLALVEDAYEVAAGLAHVRPGLIVWPPDAAGLDELVWPGSLLVRPRTRPLPEAFAALAAAGAQQAVILTGDAPDLPGLLIGKLLRALSHAPAAAIEARDGGLVALAAGLPLPDWLTAALTTIDLDTPDAFAALRRAAPHPGLVQAAPGWHRLRTPADISLLDPGLEGWEATRALLTGG